MLATLHVLAAENGDSLELLPETPELIWGFVAFALLMVVMFRLVFPRINSVLEERQQSIQGQITEAEQAKAKAEELRRSYEAQLAEARDEAEAILAEARSQAEAVRREAVSRGEEEANQILARAREEAEAERARVVSELRGQVGAMSIELASKIVEKEIDAEQHRELVDAYINELSGLN